MLVKFKNFNKNPYHKSFMRKLIYLFFSKKIAPFRIDKFFVAHFIRILICKYRFWLYSNTRKQISLSIPFASERTCLCPLRTCKTSSILHRIFVEDTICFLFLTMKLENFRDIESICFKI